MSSWAILAAAGVLAAPQVGDNAIVAAKLPTESTATPGPAEGFIRLPAAMPVDIEIAEPVGSNISRIDDMFAIRIGAPVMHDGKVLIASGVLGRGQVVHAAKSTGLGKAGELILAARYIDCGTLRIPLRGLRFDAAGTDRAGQIHTAIVVAGMIAAPLAFIKGGAALVPVGTHATAKLSTTIDVPVTGCAVPIGSEGAPAGAPVAATPQPVVATAAPASAEKQK